VENAIAGFLNDTAALRFSCSFISHVWRDLPAASRSGAWAGVEHNEHGWISYFTAFQATSCFVLFATSVPLALVDRIAPKRNSRFSRGVWLQRTLG